LFLCHASSLLEGKGMKTNQALPVVDFVDVFPTPGSRKRSVPE